MGHHSTSTATERRDALARRIADIVAELALRTVLLPELAALATDYATASKEVGDEPAPFAPPSAPAPKPGVLESALRMARRLPVSCFVADITRIIQWRDEQIVAWLRERARVLWPHSPAIVEAIGILADALEIESGAT